jgi:hypothetical protein
MRVEARRGYEEDHEPSRAPPVGSRHYLAFLRSSPKLGLVIILGLVLLVDVGVKFYQWERDRPR